MIGLATPGDDGHYEDLLLESFPEGFLPRWLGMLSRTYHEAFAYAYGNYREPEAHDILGHDRRARIEEGTRFVADSFGVHCRAVKNKSGNYHHRELRSGLLVLTQCYSDDYRVRPAVHREELASQTGDLFDGFREALEASGFVFGILLHGAHPKNRARVGYARACFPDADCDRYRTRIDLLRLFPAVGISVAPEEEVADETEIRPKRKSKEADN